jgi:hypothetical protein
VAIALTWLSIEMTPTTPIWRLVLPFIAMGIGMAFIWSPLAATATRHLPAALAGAGSGVYNATRQVGSVLGSASMAAFMTSRISAEMPGGGQRPAAEGSVTKLPPFLHEPFSAALSQSLLLPAFVALFGVVAALFLRGFGDGLRPAQVEFDDGPDERHAFTAARVAAPMNAEHDHFPDDDEYVEYLIDWDEPYPPSRAVRQQAAGPEGFAGDESDTEVLRVHVEHPLHAPAETWHGGPVETWHSLLDDEVSDDPVEFEPPPSPYAAPYAAPIAVPYVVADPVATADVDANGDRPWRSILDDLLADMPAPQTSAPEPIGFSRNGFHIEHEQHLQVPPPVVEPSRGRHARGADDDDAGTYGRHSMRFRD